MLKKGDLVTGVVKKVESYGLFLELENGESGLLSKDAMHISKNKKLPDLFFEGYVIKASVVAKKNKYYTLTQKEIVPLKRKEEKIKANKKEGTITQKNELEKNIDFENKKMTLKSLKKMKSIGNLKISVKKTSKKELTKKLKEKNIEEKKAIINLPYDYIEKMIIRYKDNIKKFEEIKKELRECGYLDEN